MMLTEGEIVVFVPQQVVVLLVHQQLVLGFAQIWDLWNTWSQRTGKHKGEKEAFIVF